MVRDGTISRTIAKDVFKEMYRQGGSAEGIARKKGLIQISSEAETALIVEQVIRENADQVSVYKKGKGRLLGFFVGEVMERTHRMANARLVNVILRRALEKQ
jgi:aspartyl-tRNA(Asn)/glutamyl-tRNA(Gln) amidotransferase subunit B